MARTELLASERVVTQAPMSLHGAWIRTWRMIDYRGRTAEMATPVMIGVGILLLTAGLLTVAAWWVAVICWYLFFGLWLVPYRLIRRGSRKRKRENLQHREMLNMIGAGHAATGMPPTAAPAGGPSAPLLDPGAEPPALPPA